jgi:hypothetical protein
MKSILRTILFVVVVQQPVVCQQVSEQAYEIRAEVRHEDGSPVARAKLCALSLKPVGAAAIVMGKPTPTEISETDATGHAVLRFKSLPTPSGGVVIGKTGYYGSGFPNVIWKPVGKFEDGSWRTEIKAVLKPVKNPIPMYASFLQSRIRIPALDTTYGYDLMLASPLPPLGNGKFADFNFRIVGIYTDRTSHTLKLIVSFPNEHDGFVEFETPQRQSMTEPQMDGSSYISGYEAPAHGYKNHLERISRRNPDDGQALTDNDHHRNYYFRVRTSVDAKGNIVQANYGKMYGDFGFVGGNHSVNGNFASIKWIGSYFNPTPNDRNVEFDPKKNLLHSQTVTQP